MELGFLAGRAATLSTLHPDVQRAVIAAPTGLSRIEALANHVHRENSAVKIDIRREGIDRRVVCEMLGFQNSPFVGFVEWKVIGAEAVSFADQTAPGHERRGSEKRTPEKAALTSVVPGRGNAMTYRAERLISAPFVSGVNNSALPVFAKAKITHGQSSGTVGPA